MSIEVACTCGKKLAVKDEHAGKKVKCPGCARVNPVPIPEADDMVFDVLEEGPEAGNYAGTATKTAKAAKSMKGDGTERSEMARMYLEHADKEMKKRKKSTRRRDVSWGRDGEGGFMMFGVLMTAGALGGLGTLIAGILAMIFLAFFPPVAWRDYRIMGGAMICTAIGAITFIKAVFFGEED